MVRLKFDIELRYEIAEQASDFLFNIHAAHTPSQTVVSESLRINQSLQHATHSEGALGSRYLRLKAQPGELTVAYEATVDLAHHLESPIRLEEVSIENLPAEVFPYIYSQPLLPVGSPSQACRRGIRRAPARLLASCSNPGLGPQAHKLQDRKLECEHVRVGYRCRPSGSVPGLRSPHDRLCRAVKIPARFVTGIDFGATPALGPPDFHAYVEVFLTDRWYIFDATGISPPMGLVRLGTGRDAADVSVATIFGQVRSFPPTIRIDAIDDPAIGASLPWRTNEGSLHVRRSTFAINQ